MSESKLAMPETKFIPAEGRTVPLEDGTPWPLDDKGRPAPLVPAPSRYVRRRIKDGDLVPAGKAAAPASSEPEPAETAPVEPTETTPKTGSARRREKTES
mgnify:CR=1 FL=1